MMYLADCETSVSNSSKLERFTKVLKGRCKYCRASKQLEDNHNFEMVYSSEIVARIFESEHVPKL
jgi:hypothetical protein